MIWKDYTYNDTKKSACHHLADDEDFVLCEAAGAGDAQRGAGE